MKKRHIVLIVLAILFVLLVGPVSIILQYIPASPNIILSASSQCDRPSIIEIWDLLNPPDYSFELLANEPLYTELSYAPDHVMITVKHDNKKIGEDGIYELWTSSKVFNVNVMVSKACEAEINIEKTIK